MNAVIYARYSSDAQREESIDGQLRDCRDYASKNGIDIVGVYIDRALSAKTDARPQFQKMIKDSNSHKFEAVLVWKLDRFSRNRYDSAHYKHLLQKNHVHVISAMEPISNTPEGIILESMLEGMAEYYSAELAEKVARGERENALKGKFNGGTVPMGYRIDEEQHYQIDPETAPIVQEIFTRYADGETIKEIGKSLNERGVRTRQGKLFSKNSFSTLFKNRRYLGEYWYKGARVDSVKIPALVSPEIFERVQRRMKHNKQAAASAATDVDYLLTTKLFCGKCGTMMAGESGTSHTGRTHYYYKCSTAKRKGKAACSLKAVRKEPLERFVVKTAVNTVLNDAAIEKLTDLLLQYAAQESTTLPGLKKSLAEVERKLQNVMNAIEQGFLTDTVRQRLNDLEQQRKDLSAAIIQEELERPMLTREQILAWFEMFRHGSVEDVEYQRTIIDCFVNSVYVFDDHIAINFNAHSEAKTATLKDILGSTSNGDGAPQKDDNVDTALSSFLFCRYDTFANIAESKVWF